MIPCTPWISEEDLSDCGLCDIGSVSAPQSAMLLEAATQIIYLLTGEQWPGQCEDIVRPCKCGCGPVVGDWAGPWPVRTGSGWMNICGGCGGYCGAGAAAILLPRRPVIEVLSVTIDGAPEPDYRLDSPGWLVRTDGGHWPSCQDITAATASPDTWEVSYLWGKVPPAAVRFAATVYASELVKACAGDASCRIPAGAVNVTQRGVSYDIELMDGQTGLYEVDQVIRAFNPHGRKRRARIYAPDDRRWVRSVSGS